MTRQYLFLIIVAIVVAGLVSTAVYYLLRARRASKSSWASILARLVPVNNQNIAIVAHDLIDDDGKVRTSDAPELEPEAIWDLLGGLNGLETLGANCEAFDFDLAAYVQLWYPEALVVAEQLRLNAREIKWHIERLEGDMRPNRQSPSRHLSRTTRPTRGRNLLPDDPPPAGPLRRRQRPRPHRAPGSPLDGSLAQSGRINIVPPQSQSLQFLFRYRQRLLLSNDNGCGTTVSQSSVLVFSSHHQRKQHPLPACVIRKLDRPSRTR